MDDVNKPETEADGKLVQDRRRYRALQSLPTGYKPLSAQEEHDQENEDVRIQQAVLRNRKH